MVTSASPEESRCYTDLTNGFEDLSARGLFRFSHTEARNHLEVPDD